MVQNGGSQETCHRAPAATIDELIKFLYQSLRWILFLKRGWMNLAVSEKPGPYLLWLAFRIGFDLKRWKRLWKLQVGSKMFSWDFTKNIWELIPKLEEHTFQLGWFNHHLCVAPLHLEVALSTLGLSTANFEDKGIERGSFYNKKYPGVLQIARLANQC